MHHFVTAPHVQWVCWYHSYPADSGPEWPNSHHHWTNVDARLTIGKQFVPFLRVKPIKRKTLSNNEISFVVTPFVNGINYLFYSVNLIGLLPTPLSLCSAWSILPHLLPINLSRSMCVVHILLEETRAPCFLHYQFFQQSAALSKFLYFENVLLSMGGLLNVCTI